MLTCGLRVRCAIALVLGPFLLAIATSGAAAHDNDNRFSGVACSTASCLVRAGTVDRPVGLAKRARSSHHGTALTPSRSAKANLAPPPQANAASLPWDCVTISLDGPCLAKDDSPRVSPGRANGGRPDREALVRQAVGRLSLPSPVIGMSPEAGFAQVVGVPTWLWIGGVGWRSVSKTVRVPGLFVTASAVPQRVVWSMGDGGTVTCRGSGTLYSSRFPADERSPDCGYVYPRSSAGQSGGTFRVSATVMWDVVWRGGGRSGRIPGLRTGAEVAVRVTEVQGVVVSDTGI
jgi:hypothetical protein